MTHFSESSQRLVIRVTQPANLDELLACVKGTNEVVVLRLPSISFDNERNQPLTHIGETLACVAQTLGSNATLIVIGETIDLVRVLEKQDESVRYQHWVAVRRAIPIHIDNHHLPNEHFGLLILTRYQPSLRHTKTRIAYTYCPLCDRTTKDYGGKKHTYHEGGTLISDVWRDISIDLDGDLQLLLERLADLFGVEDYSQLLVFDLATLNLRRGSAQLTFIDFEENHLPEEPTDKIINSDCLEGLRNIPTGSIDFAFTDPPYNLGKGYAGYSDDLEIIDYFNWCDQWINELSRVLKPGRTLALLNIPIWAVRHFLHMDTILTFQNWIVWDALAFPVRMIMPAHYTILCFSKGEPRALPGLVGQSEAFRPASAPRTFNTLRPLADGYCLRANCVADRRRLAVDDRATLTDLWSDIHRLKHNSRRVDHPTQLPPHLLYRLISIFSQPGEVVLDCFNGSGTTTLTAHQLKRRYVGIELSEKYCRMAEERHLEIINGLDPFRKVERVLTAKNSPVPRLKKQVYKVSKKTLQLEVKRITQQLGHIPSREELIAHTGYPIEYYDDYFVSWGEVTAAARTTGMSEKRSNGNSSDSDKPAQLRLLESDEDEAYL